MDLSLRGYVAAVLRAQPAADLPRLVDDLGQAARAIRTTTELAAALSDVAVPVAVRRAVVQDLFEPRVHPAVLRVLLHAVDIERAPELLSALHEADELARVRVDHADEADMADDRPLGRAGVRRLLGGMAAAELEPVVEVDELHEIEDELFRFARLVGSQPALREALANWSVPAAHRSDLALDLLQGKARPETVRLVTAAVRMRTRDVVAVLDWLAELAAAARGWRVARVRAAMEVDAGERQRIADALGRLTGKPVELQVSIDPSLLAGARVEIGDLLVDATTRHRLDQLQEQLASPEGAVRVLLDDSGPEGRR